MSWRCFLKIYLFFCRLCAGGDCVQLKTREAGKTSIFVRVAILRTDSTLLGPQGSARRPYNLPYTKGENKKQKSYFLLFVTFFIVVLQSCNRPSPAVKYCKCSLDTDFCFSSDFWEVWL